MSLRTLVVNFENAFAIKGIPYLQENVKDLEITGLLARNVSEGVYKLFPDLPIFEKKISLEYLIQFKSDQVLTLKLIEYLRCYEDQIFYHINRYFDTQLGFDYSLIKYKIIVYVLEIINQANPKLIYFGVTPHDPVSYILYLVASNLNLEVIIITENYVLRSYVLYKEIGKQIQFISNGDREENKEYLLYKQNHVKVCLLALIKSEPEYMKEQRRTTGSFLRKMANSLWVKRRVSMSGWLRYRKAIQMKKSYESSLTILNEDQLKELSGKVIFFSLHFQPELTTSPDGGIFAQQWLAIKKLAEKFKNGYTILIKEHPSQFMINAKPVRSQIFYQALLSLAPNIKLISLDLSTKVILKYVSGVCTITGTVGYESLLNGLPVLFFGDSRFSQITGAFDANEDQGIEDFEKAIGMLGSFNLDDVLNDFNLMVESKFYYCYDQSQPHEERTLRATNELLNQYWNWRAK